MKNLIKPFQSRVSHVIKQSECTVLAAAFLLMWSAVSGVSAAPGPGITQATWTAAEIGKEFFRFSNATVGPQPTYADFQHGYLYYGSAPSVGGAVPGKISWYNLSNPRTPTLITQVDVTGNKPHMAGYWEDRMIDGFQGSSMRIWDFDDKVVAGTYAASVDPVFYMVQAPYVFRPRNGYGSGGNNLEIAKVTNTSGSLVNVFDLGSIIGFPVGGLHAVGNVLICTGSQAAGVATLDISDPGNPKLIDQLVVGGPPYTSMMHGNRLYSCETGSLIRVYDVSNPADIVEVGVIDLPNSPRYVTLQDGFGYCCPGAARLIKFDATALTITTNWALPERSDFVQIVGNMAFTGGNAGMERTSLVPIAMAPDTAGPTVGFHSPAKDAQMVPLTSRVGLVMSDQIDVTSLNTSSFIVRPLGGSALVGTFSTQMGIINFSPAVPLLRNTVYEVVLPAGGVRDTVGNPIATTFTSTFSTGGLPGSRWPLNNSNANAVSGGAPLNLVNGPTYSPDRTEGSHSIQLNGQNQYLDAGVLNFGNQFSIAALVKIPATSTGIQTLAANSIGGAAANGFRLFVNASGPNAGSIIFETGNGIAAVAAKTNSGVFQFGQWNHVVVTVDRAQGTARIYYNKVDQTVAATIRADFNNTASLNFGRMLNGSNFLNGGLDDIRLYNTRLTSTQVSQIIISDLTARWGFNNSTIDLAGNLTPITLVNGPGYSTDRVEGSHALILNGTNQYATSSALPISSTTISTWIKVPSTATNIQAIAANSVGGSTTTGFRFYLNSFNTNDRKIVLETANGAINASINTAGNILIPNQWNHVALVMERTAGTARIYVNGVERANGAIRTDFANDRPLVIGAFNNGDFSMEGGIDDFRIYQRALTAAEIVQLADDGENDVPILNNLTANDQTPLIGSQVNFTATATDANPADTLRYSFDFGDGSASTPFAASNLASRVYTAPGRYPVNVTVTDGTTQTSRQMLVVVHHPISSPAPTASSQLIHDAVLGKIWCVNPDSNTVTRLHAATLTKELELPAGTAPRSLALHPNGTQLWVVAEKSDELRVFNPSTGTLLQTVNLPHGSAPVAVAFAPNGTAAFIAAKGSKKILKLDPATRFTIASLPLSGQPFSIAVSSDSSRVLVARFISPDTRGEVWEVNATTLSLSRTFPLAFDTSPDTENSGGGLPNYLQHAVISPDGLRAWVPSKKDNIARGALRNGLPLDHDNTVRSIISQLDLTTNLELPSARRDIDNHGLPGSMCFSPLGDLAFVTYQGNDEIRVFNTATGSSVTSVATDFAPQSVCLNADGSRLYVMNFLSRSVAVYNSAPILAGTGSTLTLLNQTTTVTTELLSADVLTGKRIFYNATDPRMSAEGYISCSICHLDGGHDGRTWDFTDRGEGLRNTTTLLGSGGMAHGRVHWSGNFDEIQDFEQDIRGPFSGTGFLSDVAFNVGTRSQSLGDPKAGLSPELDALAAYVSSLGRQPRSPHRSDTGVETPAAINGRRHFVSLNCMECHSGDNLTDSATNTLHNIGTLKLSSGKRLGAMLTGIDTPTLRGLADTAPYLHDGSAATLADVFTSSNAPEGTGHADFRTLDPASRQELLAYLLQLESEGNEVTVVATDSLAAEPVNNGTFTFTRTGRDISSALTVFYTVAGSATQGLDYQDLGPSVTFPAGQASVTKTVIVSDEAVIEPTENVVLTLFNGADYVTGTSRSAVVSISSNDIAPLPDDKVSLLGSWVQGATRAKENGSNRALVVMVYGESSGSTISASAVTYGGQAMTKVVERPHQNGSTSYTAAFVLNEAGVAAATSGNIVVTWGTPPNTGSDITSAFFANVNQTTPTGLTDSNGLTGTAIATPALATNPGDLVVVGATAANNGTYDIVNGFTRGIAETSASFGDITSAHKLATGASETPSLTHTNSQRHTIVGFVLKMNPVTFDDWAGLYGLTGSDALVTADSDADGVMNIVEYVLWLSPISPDVNPVRFDQVVVGGQTYLRLTVNRNPAVKDVLIEGLSTGTLENLASWRSSFTVVEINTASSFSVRDSVPLGTGGKRFIRLRFTKQ